MAGIADCDRGTNNPNGSGERDGDEFECPFCGAIVGKLPDHLPECGET